MAVDENRTATALMKGRYDNDIKFRVAVHYVTTQFQQIITKHERENFDDNAVYKMIDETYDEMRSVSIKVVAELEKYFGGTHV